MNGMEFQRIRLRLGLNEAEFAAELGYTGKGKNRVNLIRDFESGRKRIPLYIARLAWLVWKTLYADGDPIRLVYTAPGFKISWPHWPGYTREELEDASERTK